MEASALSKYMLFRGMNEDEIKDALNLLEAKERNYEKDETILYAGDRTAYMGIVLDGSVTVESNDIWGNRTILSHVGKGQYFAETYAFLQNEPLLVDVSANEKCIILFLKIRTIEENNRQWSARLLFNLLAISAHKNLHLSGRSFHTSPKSIRGRVMSYLNSVSLKTGKREFDIPFDRQQLANYLNVERTALSKELGKMQKDEYFTVRKNHFIILKEDMEEY